MVGKGSQLLKLGLGLQATSCSTPISVIQDFVVLSGSLLDLTSQELFVIVAIDTIAHLFSINSDTCGAVFYSSLPLLLHLGQSLMVEDFELF